MIITKENLFYDLSNILLSDTFTRVTLISLCGLYLLYFVCLLVYDNH